MNGYTMMHEHITIDLSGVKKDTDCQLDCYAETVAEFKKLYEYGVRRIVDVTADGMGRNQKADHLPKKLRNHCFTGCS